MNSGEPSIQDILLEALKIEEAERRVLFLSKACGTDQAGCALFLHQGPVEAQ
jgi:hypothetical protein